MVCAICPETAARLLRSARPAGIESLSRAPSALYPRRPLRVSLHSSWRRRGLVEARANRAVLPSVGVEKRLDHYYRTKCTGLPSYKMRLSALLFRFLLNHE